jgi:serine phosphatase RsbU (regulator of sigma subunit)
MRIRALPTVSAWLVPISGPEIDPIELSPLGDGVTLGRGEGCEARLPLSAEQVSRQHARFVHDAAGVRVIDLASRWGTFVNGMRLESHRETPLADGDLVRITPWTFSLSPTSSRRGLAVADDAVRTVVRSVTSDTAQPLAQEMLALLLESAAAIHGSANEKQLAERVIDAAVRGTGLSHAFMLKPLDNHSHYEVLAARQPGEGVPASFSRSLLSAAAGGQVAEISGGSGSISESIVQMQISAALCVPLMLGATAAAFLYLDSRGVVPQALRPNASGFCVALGRMASLALANLKRQEMEKREAHLHAELNAAAAAQASILPDRQTSHGGIDVLGESRPGQMVGGDFFDVIPLADGRLVVTVGDVSGKGISASVLMTTAQGFLHAAILNHGDLAAAMDALNRYLHPRRPASRFVTMWAGLFDPSAATLHYVDAGHSYALLRRGDGTIVPLNEGGGFPVGIDPATAYRAQSVPVAGGDGVLVVSDGIVEQFDLPRGTAEREQFGMRRIEQTLASPADDPVATLFAALLRFARTERLSDDATAVWIAVRPS